MKYERSEALEKFLDDEIARFGKEEKETKEPSNDHLQEIEAVVMEEIKDLESRFDTLSEDDKEYLEWLKADE